MRYVCTDKLFNQVIDYLSYFTARNDSDDCNKLAQLMISRNSPVARQLKTILGIDQTKVNNEAENLGVEDIRIRAGGRHDNDKSDFRSIRVMPTVQEISSEGLPYLPQNQVMDEASALERQFRLLREDMVGPARKELRLMRKGEGNLRNLFNGVAIEKVDVPTGKTSTPPHVLVSFDLHPDHKIKKDKKYRTHKERKQYWETYSKGDSQNLVILVLKYHQLESKRP